MKAHGSGQACAAERRVPRCEECRAYRREAQRLRQLIPQLGTHRYNYMHGVSQHGSGGACAAERRVPRCEECRAYARETQFRARHTPGTNTYMASHGEGVPGLRRVIRDMVKRDAINRALHAEQSAALQQEIAATQQDIDRLEQEQATLRPRRAGSSRSEPARRKPRAPRARRKR